MEQLQPEISPILAEKRLVGFEANIPPAVEIESRKTVGQRRYRAVEGGSGEIPRPLHNVLVAERRGSRSRGRRSVGLGGRGGG